MSNTFKFIILGALVVAIVVVVLFIIRNTRKSEIRREIEDLNVRYNAIKTVPLAFKLNKAQAMAKRNDDTSEKVQSYYNRYVEAQKHIDQIEEMIEDTEDDLMNRNEKQAKETIETLKTMITDCENEVSSIDEFLEQFSHKENEQRDVSAKLKEEYREIKMKINDNSNLLAIAYEGLSKKLEKIEDLFSQSEEWMYANDYGKAEEVLADIGDKMNEAKLCFKELPDLVKDAKGVIPVLFDEVTRQYELGRQRGVYLDHLNVNDRLNKNQTTLNACVKTLIDADYDGVKELIENIKGDLNGILASLEKENKDFADGKTLCENINTNIENIKRVYTYVEGAYATENERYNLEEINDYLKEVKTNLDEYAADAIKLSEDLASNIKPSSSTKEELEALFNKTESVLEKLTNYKNTFDKNSNDEERAKTQLVKLQVVLNEVEVKVLEYHLPAIADNYREDLKAGRERISKIKQLLEEIPLNISKLNETLDEAIDYIYTFYNNVNNIVGMAIMVENAIVFGNKYRSTYNVVDRDLSRAEFSYLNGEYTRALTMAIACMETLFPNKANEKILESN